MPQQISFLNKHTPPLAEKMRPSSLDEIVGQDHLVSKDKFFYKSIINDTLGSCIFWGPPGTGKTTLANIIAKTTNRVFVSFNAAFDGIKEVRKIIEQAKIRIKNGAKNTIIFIDEIHRFNKAQQDAFLQPIEKGTIILIGATTENPSFEINSALLSRCSVYTLNNLKNSHIKTIINRAIKNSILYSDIVLKKDAEKLLINLSNGDARIALNVLEHCLNSVIKNESEKIITTQTIKQIMSSRQISYDKNGEQHYNLISALHKSLRGSDPQAAIYWLARMIEGGADPKYIARRLVRFASEGIGLADPQALIQALAAKEAVHFLGYPEGDTALAQCVIYLATAPKSNKLYIAIKAAKQDVYNKPNEPVPMHIRNAPTKLMKNLGYGKNYQYDHDSNNNFSGQDFLPEALKNSEYYTPGQYGFEREIKKRIEYWKKLKKQINQEQD